MRDGEQKIYCDKAWRELTIVVMLLESYYHVGGLSPNRSGNLVVVPVGVCGLPETNF